MGSVKRMGRAAARGGAPPRKRMRGAKGKRVRGEHVREDEVPWRSLPVASTAESVNETFDEGFEGWEQADGEFLGLQAADGFDVVYEPDSSGRNKTVKLIKVGGKGDRPKPADQDTQEKAAKDGKRKKKAVGKSQDGAHHTETTAAAPQDQEAVPMDGDVDRADAKDDAEAKEAAGTDDGEGDDFHDAVETDGADVDQAPEDYEESPDARDEEPEDAGDEEPGDAGDQDDGATPGREEQDAEDEDDPAAVFAAARAQGIALDAESLREQLGAWKPNPFHVRLLQALSHLGFERPTPIQAQTLAPALGLNGRPRDVVGIAQTGSGKTLAYGLPILQYILQNALDISKEPLRPLEALVLAPTRELALQVARHLQQVSDAGGRIARIAPICGGMAVQKQERMLRQHGGAHIVVATPGRLWDMLKHDNDLAHRVRQTRFLVIDEADRMVESGHFAEMDAILRMVRRTKGAAVAANEEMQTFVYSATMTKALQSNLQSKPWRRKRRQAAEDEGDTLDDLISRVDFRDAEPCVVELTPERRVAETLIEAKIECLAKEKDTYLYYLLLRYPGRTLVFLNSVDGIRRLQPLLATLGISAYPLHGQMAQQQRLKNLDRFRRGVAAPGVARPGGARSGSKPGVGATVLLATDVAARGLDVVGVDHVVHFQIPRTADAYVHRSGRTARAGQEGVSVALIEPAEQRRWAEIWRALQRQDRLPSLPVEYTFLERIRERLQLAREIDSLVHRETKQSHDDAWLRNLAQDAEIGMESDEGSDADDNEAAVHSRSGRRRGKGARAARDQIGALRAQLDALLAKPLSARGVSQRYLTAGSRPEFVESMLSGSRTYTRGAPSELTADSDQMLGVKRSSVLADMRK